MHQRPNPPMKLGGCGIPSFKECAPLARAAMEESADRVLDGDGLLAGPVPKQGARCMTAFIERRERLFDKLDEQSRLTVIDSGSHLGRKWAPIIPFDSFNRLFDSDICAAMHLRTLCPGSADICRRCSLPNTPGHDEVCHSRPNWRLARHELVKKSMLYHLSTVDQCTV